MSRIAFFVMLAALVACDEHEHEHDHETELLAQIAELEQQVDQLETQLGQATQDLATRTQERDALASQLDALQMKSSATVSLEVPLLFGSQAMTLGTPYDIGGGDTISFREVRYWLTNISLKRSDNTFVDLPDGYYLVEARPEQPLTNGTEAAVTLPANRRETVSLKGIPVGDYVAIRFHVGVDPARNDDLSNNAGELHTLKNMTFDNGWMWFTSYIFTKTRADLAGTGGSAVVSWDNGSNADFREVSLDFPSALQMAPGGSYTVRIAADLAALVTDVSPRQRLVINAGTPADRTLLADGFRDMFSMVSATANP